jgi:hypothetical protein
MDINLSAACIAQYKIPRSGVFELSVGVTSLLQEVTERRNILLLNSNVQVLVWPGLLTEQRINAPSAVDPQFYANTKKPAASAPSLRCNGRKINS